MSCLNQWKEETEEEKQKRLESYIKPCTTAKNPDVIYETKPGMIKEVLEIIKREELLAVNKRHRAKEIWLDINAGEVEVIFEWNPMSGSKRKNTDGEGGKILLWTRVENRSISEVINMLAKRDDAPFFGKSFVEWYLREKFSDRILWQI